MRLGNNKTRLSLAKMQSFGYDYKTNSKQMQSSIKVQLKNFEYKVQVKNQLKTGRQFQNPIPFTEVKLI